MTHATDADGPETGSTPARQVPRRTFLGQGGLAVGAALAAGTPGLRDAAAQAPQSEITSWDADTLSRRIRGRDVSCVEVMRAYLTQIRRLNPRINAVVALQDEGRLMEEAALRDAQLARGEYLGWMHGMPQAIKDTALTRGIVTTSGSPLLRDQVPTVDSVIVERARQHGAILIGKTNVPEFALGSNTVNPIYGATVNPYNLVKTVGGSSGGAGAALAAQMLPVADGSDMGGSIRNPAGFCNVYGLRPTAGVVPFAPSDELFVQQFATEGPMGRTVRDVAMLLSVQAGHDPRAPLSVNLDPMAFRADLNRDMTGLRIAWLGDWNGYFPTQPGVLDLCQSTLQVFRDLGCIVEAATPAFDPAMLWNMWLTHRAWIMGNYLGAFYQNPAQRELMNGPARWEVEASFNITSAQVFESSVQRTAWAAAVRDFFGRYDFAIAPTAQVFPFDATTLHPTEVAGRRMETYHQWMGIVLPWTLAGTPVMAAPAGFSADGLPLGIQIIGKRQADFAVLQMARAYERATGWVQRRPPALLQRG